MNALLEEQLGQPLTTKQVSEYLGVDKATVRKYYADLGGIKFGSCYRFFEKRLIDAILQGSEKEVDRASAGSGQKRNKTIPHKERSKKVGVKLQRGVVTDPHDLLA